MVRALAVATLSGFAGLGYQIVWTQQGALWLGHEATAALAVIAGFLGGIAAGARWLGERVERSASPETWYAACEALIGAWALVLALVLPQGATLFARAVSGAPPAGQWAIAFGGTFVLLLPSTFAMGATLPALERILERMLHGRTSIASLYASNTAGAFLGVLACALVLLPAIGLVRTAILCAACNLACAVAVAAWSPRGSAIDARARQGGMARNGFVLMATGFLGIAYEVIVLRVLGQVLENTVFTFALLLAVYLAGTSAGAAAYARLPSELSARHARDRLALLVAIACGIGLAALSAAPSIKRAAQAALGSSYPAALAVEASLAIAAFMLPTMAMGALFAHLATEARESGTGLARSLAWNTLGAALAPVVMGAALLPVLGAKSSALLLLAGYLVLCSRLAWRTPLAWCAASLVVALAWGLRTLAIVDVPHGGQVLFYREGVNAAVSVVQDAAGVARLHINNRQQEGSSATTLADSRQGLLPILLHPQPRDALFLGLGTGVTAAAAAQDPSLRVHAVELLPEVVEASRLFAHPGPLAISIADARRFVRAGQSRFDVIVADNFHPARSGSAALYTVEHFRALRARLAPDGVFCQWLPLHQLDVETLRIVVRAYVEVFPRAYAMLATYSLETPVIGLVARNDDAPFSIADVDARVREASLPLARFGLDDAEAVLGTFIAGPGALTAFAAGAALNTDDRPVVAYLAPRVTYAAAPRPRERLATVMQSVRITSDDLAPASNEAGLSMSAYWRARDRFVALGQGVEPSPDPARMLDQVGQPLMDLLRISPGFRPAYDPLISLADALAPRDPRRSEAIIAEATALRSRRAEAYRTRRRPGLRRSIPVRASDPAP